MNLNLAVETPWFRLSVAVALNEPMVRTVVFLLWTALRK